MTDEPRIEEDAEAVEGLDLALVQEQQARAKLNIPLYDSEKDKENGKFHELTGEERWRLEEYLGKPHQGDGAGESTTIDGTGEEGAEAHMSREEISEKALEHRRAAEAAFEDLRGRFGTSEFGGIVPEPGSPEEKERLREVIANLKNGMEGLRGSKQAKVGNAAFDEIMTAYDSVSEYFVHRKAYLGLSAYLKEHTPKTEARREEQERQMVEAESEHRRILRMFGMRH